MTLQDLYIAGTGVTIPPLADLRAIVDNGLYSEADLAETRLESIAVAADDFPADMAAAAARGALAASGHRAEDIAVTLHAYIASQGLFGWHAAAYVHKLAVGNTSPVIEVRQMSNGGMAALGLAAAHLRAWPDLPAALVTTADRFEELPHGRWNFDQGLIPGDGATACVLSRRQGFARIRGLQFHSESDLEGMHRGDAELGGELSVVSAPPLRQRKQEFLVFNPMSGLAKMFTEATDTVVAKAFAEAGVAKQEISHWILPNIGLHELETFYLKPLDISLESTCWDWGRTVGHLGAGDQVAGLHHLRETGALRPGQLCAVLGVGAGFNWSCGILEICGSDE